ncbi:MAG: exodeoxyribonuclease VII large subunit [Deltaproteobacteria bacterium]|nr:MAG: exodeoxyribonuclease VII large subunit [Deltaproteobacteria bacterium]
MSSSPSTESRWTPAPGEVLSVSDLAARVREMTERSFSDIWVEGEISNLRVPASGHAYFTLTDDAAQLRCVCFRSARRLLPFSPENGDEVLARGRLSIYEQRGDLQLIVDFMEPMGEGAALVAFELLKKKLAAEGLFDEGRKRELPAMVRKVAVVTSPTGAAVRDIIEVLGRRAPWVSLTIAPTRVQGAEAPSEIIKAINDAQLIEGAELLIVGRGGGSGEDLSAFNDEGVVRAVASSSLPVISAVGHEIDFTLTDFAADKRAPTPSAAAEMAVREGVHFKALLERAELSLLTSVSSLISEAKQKLTALDPARYEPGRKLEMARVHADRLIERSLSALMEKVWESRSRYREAVKELGLTSPELRVSRVERKLDSLDAHLAPTVTAILAERARSLMVADEGLKSLDPKSVLKRGYSILSDVSGRILRDAADVKAGDHILATLAKGSLDMTVDKSSDK